MKNKTFVLTCIAITILFCTAQATTYAVDFANAIIKRFPNTINDMTDKGWEYSNSTILHGIEKVYEQTKNPEYLEYIQNYVDSFVDDDGNVDFDADQQSLDKVHPGIISLFLYKETGEQKYKKAADRMLSAIQSQPRNASGGFWHKKKYPNQMWGDGIYMAEPFLARYGYRLNEGEFCDTTPTFQTLLLSSHAYVPSTKLVLHGWDETKEASWADQTTGLSPEVWSRGMGWFVMAVVDILKYLPKNHSSYEAMTKLLNDCAAGLKDSQDASTGLWYQVVNKGSEPGNWIETSGSAMFIYGLKRGVDYGFIDKQYLTVAQKGWEGLQTKITSDDDGPVINEYVGAMGIKDDYETYIEQVRVSCPPSKHPHGYCAVLMAASAMEDPAVSKYRLSITVKGKGKVANSSGEIFQDSGVTITLIATPDNGFTFSKWEGDATGTNATKTVVMNAEKEVTALFVDDSPITFQPPGSLKNGSIYCSSLQGTTHLSFSVLKKGNMVIELFNSNGTCVSRTSAVCEAGSNSVGIDTNRLAAGIYFVRSSFDGISSTFRATLMK